MELTSHNVRVCSLADIFFCLFSVALQSRSQVPTRVSAIAKHIASGESQLASSRHANDFAPAPASASASGVGAGANKGQASRLSKAVHAAYVALPMHMCLFHCCEVTAFCCLRCLSGSVELATEQTQGHASLDTKHALFNAPFSAPFNAPLE